MPVLDKSNSNEVKRFEEFIETSPYGHFMQSTNWAKIKNNWDSDYVYLEEDGKIIASMSILSVKNDGVNSFMYVPRGPVCNLMDFDILKGLIKEAKPIVEERKGFLLRLDPEVIYSEELKNQILNLDIENLELRTRGLREKSFSNPRMHMVLDIKDKSYDDFLNALKSKDRNKLKTPYKKGLKISRIRKDDPEFEEAMDTFYDLTKIMAKRQGITHRPKEYFLRMFDAFEDAVIYQSGDDEEILASSLVIAYNKKTYYAYSASSNEKRNDRAPYHINLEAIMDACEKKSSEYDMGGIFEADDSDGLYSFKKLFTGEEGLHEYIGEIDIVYNDDLYQDFLKN